MRDIHETAHGVDLHLHSERSDGKQTIRELVELAHNKGMRAIAVTDHNLVTPEAVKIGEEYGVEVATGCEFGAEYTFKNRPEDIHCRVPEGYTFKNCPEGMNKEIHMVGLFFDPENVGIKEIIQKNTQDRSLYVQAILKKLKEEENIHISYEQLVKDNPRTGYLGRMHIAEEICRQGYASCINEAFDRYIGAEGSCYVSSSRYIHYVSMEECASAILGAGGIPVLAHLFQYQITEEQRHEILKAFSEAVNGFGAMEVFYGKYDEKQRRRLKSYAEEYGLLPSAGSDSHGRQEQDMVSFPYEIYEALKKKKAELDLR